MHKIRTYLGMAIVLVTLFVIYFYVISKPYYKVSTPIKKDLIQVIKNKRSTTLETKTIPLNKGICDSSDCGNPFMNDGSTREDVTLTLDQEQVTSLLNQYLPATILLKNIRVQFRGDNIEASATSFYPVLPGQLSASGRLDIKHFYVDDVYIGSSKAPDKVANFIEANGDTLLKRSFYNNKVYVSDMRLENQKLILELNTPKGMVTTDKTGRILISQN